MFDNRIESPHSASAVTKRGILAPAEHELVGAVTGLYRVVRGIGLERLGEVLGNRGDEHAYPLTFQGILC